MESWKIKMNSKDQFFLIKSRLFTKKNIIYLIVMILVTTIIISSATMSYFLHQFNIDSLNQPLARTYIIGNPKTEEELKKLKNMKHIELVESKKYLYGVGKDTTLKDENHISGYLTITPLLKEDDIQIKSGSKLKNSGDAICSHKLYLEDVYDSSLVLNLDNSLFLHGKDILGKKFQIELNSDDYHNAKSDFNIVGTFANQEFVELNTCYVSKSDFDKIVNNYSSSNGYVDASGNEVFEKRPYDTSLVRVDNYKNMDKVNDELEALGYSTIRAFTLEEKLLGYMTTIPLFICLIVIIITINIMYNFINKKTKYNKTNYGILKSLGYTNKDIYICEVSENLILYGISLIISLIIFFIGCLIIKNNLLVEFTYINYNLKIPYFYILIFIITFALLISYFVKRTTYRLLKLNIQELLGE